MTDLPEPKYDFTLQNLFRINYVTVFDGELITWKEILATISLLIIVNVFSTALIFKDSNFNTVLYQTVFVIFLLLVFSVVCTAVQSLFMIGRIQQRRMLLIVLTHYIVAVILLMMTAFLVGVDRIPFFETDADHTVLFYSVLTFAYFCLLTTAHIADRLGTNTIRKIKILYYMRKIKLRNILSYFVLAILINFFNMRLFDLLMISSSDEYNIILEFVDEGVKFFSNTR